MDLSELVKEYYDIPGGGIDGAHGALLLGALLSTKPTNCLEFGIGPGRSTRTLLAGIGFNQKGSLTCVDNMHDYGGNLSVEFYDELQRNPKVNIVISNEGDFVAAAESNSYDFLMSDGDHGQNGSLVDKVFDMMKPDSFMFFHDVCDYPGLMRYKTRADELGKPNYLFSQSSRPNEKTERGFLMVINKK